VKVNSVLNFHETRRIFQTSTEQARWLPMGSIYSWKRWLFHLSANVQHEEDVLALWPFLIVFALNLWNYSYTASLQHTF
jgi:hypothetical protein